MNLFGGASVRWRLIISNVWREPSAVGGEVSAGTHVRPVLIFVVDVTTLMAVCMARCLAVGSSVYIVVVVIHGWTLVKIILMKSYLQVACVVCWGFHCVRGGDV